MFCLNLKDQSLGLFPLRREGGSWARDVAFKGFGFAAPLTVSYEQILILWTNLLKSKDYFSC